MKAIEKRHAAAGQSGFTLIELLIVIAILGILAAVVVFAVGNTTDKANQKACAIEFRTIKTAAEAYKGLNDTAGVYPANTGLMVGGDAGFLEEVPDPAKWSYDGTLGTPAGSQFSLSSTTGGKCDGSGLTPAWSYSYTSP